MDNVSPEERSRRMRLVRGKDTKPELEVRKLVFGMGYRYRLHAKKLPGSPDLVFAGRRKVVFVHGCFWHGHEGCKGGRLPKSNLDFWGAKLERNKARDAENQQAIRELGWDSLVVWQCELKDAEALAAKLRGFLGERANDRTA